VSPTPWLLDRFFGPGKQRSYSASSTPLPRVASGARSVVVVLADLLCFRSALRIESLTPASLGRHYY
jgi:hypothetical protein